MFQQRKGIKMRRLIRKFVLGSVSVLALGIGLTALDSALNSGADAGNTISAVNMPAASQASDISTTADSLRKDSIRWAQVELRYRGLYKGSLDGVLGPQTTRALSKFQQNNGLTQTASLDAQTWEALTTSPGIAQGSSSVPSDADRSGSMTRSSRASDMGR
jgi:peptidoglycan hydrolase-like protein with peptidoglycan-binding domain